MSARATPVNAGVDDLTRERGRADGETAAALARLEAVLAPLPSACVAFSGGVDSTLVLATAARVLGPERVVAFTATSETYRADEL
ncbi:MAG TPA: asparagine synthase-related protein, partial [Thermoleophilia bacterium]|nr:asparagine synthase-related protein [Thermoleophilia bacterium]